MDTFKFPCPACGYFHSSIDKCWGKLTPNGRYKMFVMKNGNPVSVRSYRIFGYKQTYDQLKKQALGPDPTVAVNKVSPMGELPNLNKLLPIALGVGIIWAVGIWAYR